MPGEANSDTQWYWPPEIGALEGKGDMSIWRRLGGSKRDNDEHGSHLGQGEDHESEPNKGPDI
jgi:hypothetical protein